MSEIPDTADNLRDVDKKDYLATRQKMLKAADAYYNSDQLYMDDAEYDRLASFVVAVEKQHPEWVTGAPADQVAAGVGKAGEIVHDSPMLSLDNVFTQEELEEFLARAPESSWVVEAKLDGLAASATWTEGVLTVFTTRGDGTAGEDLRGHHAALVGLPTVLDEPVTLTVRGEIYMTDQQFAQANDIRTKAGDTLLANPRNGVAGAMRAKHGRWQLPVSFAAYDWPTLQELGHKEAVQQLAKLNIATAAQLTKASEVRADRVAEQIEAIRARRATLGFPVDGAVVKVADTRTRKALAATSRAPRWATAYKFPADTVQTVLKAISLTVGRTGVITPVAELEPVSVGGVVVQYATCSNPSEVVRKDLRVGDTVWVRRAGDVIPEIVSVNLDRRPADAARWQTPSTCPRCGGGLDRSQRRWRCQQRNCGAREAVAYFASRDAMDIEGLGEGVIKLLVDANLVADAADLYLLEESALVALDKVGEVRARQLLAAIEQSKEAALNRAICALGLRGTGRTISLRLSREFTGLTDLKSATRERLASVEGIGQVKADLVLGEIAENIELIDRLIKAGVDPQGAKKATGGALFGLRVAVTGKVPGLSRTEAKEAVEKLGGTSVGAVSGSCDLVVIGEGAGSKAAAAVKLNLKILAADDFAALVQKEKV